MRRILATALLLALGGCASASMDQAECQTADWRAVGYEDGTKGYSASAFGQHRRACAEHGITAGFDAYLAGHGEGLAIFCRPQNGYRLGAGGKRYSGVCPANLEGAFLDAHGVGYGLYERRAKLNRLSKSLSYKKNRSKEIEFLVVEKTTLLVSPTVAPTDRAAIAVELKQLADERVEIERSIEQLEFDHAEAERAYEAYRSSIADRYRG